MMSHAALWNSRAEDSLSVLYLIVELFPDHCCRTSLVLRVNVEDVFLFEKMSSMHIGRARYFGNVQR